MNDELKSAIQTARDEALCALAQQIAVLRDKSMDDSKRGRCDEHNAISRGKAESYDNCMALIGDALTGVDLSPSAQHSHQADAEVERLTQEINDLRTERRVSAIHSKEVILSLYRSSRKTIVRAVGAETQVAAMREALGHLCEIAKPDSLLHFDWLKEANALIEVQPTGRAASLDSDVSGRP